MKRSITLFLTLMMLQAFSQDNNIDLYSMNFGELSKLKIITASKTEQNIKEVPTSIKVIEGTEIMDRGYFTLDEVLSDLPGFQFRNIMSLNSYVFQRGIPNQNNLTLLLIDGVQINELNSGGFYGGGQYNLSNIERIEVVCGPSSVAYGTNAVSGIINIITKKASKKQGEINTLVGNFNTQKSDFAYSYFNDKNSLGVRVSGMKKSSDKANLKGGEGDYNWSDLLDNFENDYSLGIKVNYQGFTFGTNYIQKQTSTATFQKSTGTDYLDHGTLWNILFANSYLKYEKQLSDKIHWATNVYYRNTTVLKNSILYVIDTTQVGYFRPNSLIGFENIFHYSLQKKISVIAGVVLESENLANGQSQSYSQSSLVKPPTPEKPEMRNNFLASFFIEPNLRIDNSFYLSGGLRFDQSTVYDQVLTPRAGLSYNKKKFSAHISYAEAFRAPKPWDYSDGIGNSDLVPERMKSLEGSITLYPISHLNVELTTYRNRLFNGIIKEYLNDNYRWSNGGEINTNGAEFYLTYSIKRMETIINYTYTKSKDEHGNSIPEIRKNSANASITFALTNRYKINIRANYMGECENPKWITTNNNNIIDPYLIFNGAFSWLASEKLTVQLIGKNLFNAQYYHTSNRTPDRYRQPQRTLMLSAGYRFDK